MHEYSLWELLEKYKRIKTRMSEIPDNIIRTKNPETINNYIIELKELSEELKELERVTVKTSYKL